jgi:hypothetical protein
MHSTQQAAKMAFAFIAACIHMLQASQSTVLPGRTGCCFFRCCFLIGIAARNPCSNATEELLKASLLHTLTNFTVVNSVESFSNTGPMAWHGPHLASSHFGHSDA